VTHFFPQPFFVFPAARRGAMDAFGHVARGRRGCWNAGGTPARRGCARPNVTPPKRNPCRLVGS
jgi:hypothetical protein